VNGKKAALLKRIDKFTPENAIDEKLILNPEQ
jgi:hypothetical protein